MLPHARRRSRGLPAHCLLCLVGALLAPAGLGAQAAALRVPSLDNFPEVAQALDAAFRPGDRLRHVGQATQLRLHVNTYGSVDSVLVATPSGDAEMDSAAARTALVMRFTPATREGKPVATWVVLPLEVHATPDLVRQITGAAPAPDLPLLNRAAVETAIRTVAPDRGAGPALLFPVSLGLAVDPAGLVQQVAVDTSSCVTAFDQTAVRLAGLLRYAPADSATQPRRRATRVRMTFGWDSLNLALPYDSSLWKKSPHGDPVAYDVAPEIANRNEILRLLVREYPTNLKDHGVGGTAVTQLFVDSTGAVARLFVQRSSGYCGLDFAALRVVSAMRFTPAQLAGKRVPVWIRLPIVFKVQ